LLKLLTLSLLLLGRLLAREGLRFILMPAHQIRSLLSVFILDLPPIGACPFSFRRRGFLALLLLLQMLTLESLRLRIMLLLKLSQLLRPIALGHLLLLDTLALELL
jgi:hypothetical protein